MSDYSVANARLKERLAELEDRQRHLARDLSQPLDRDSSEQAIEVEDDDSLDAQAELVATEIASVRRALARIEDGSFGTCARCGAEIPPARITARPEASLCIDCATDS